MLGEIDDARSNGPPLYAGLCLVLLCSCCASLLYFDLIACVYSWLLLLLLLLCSGCSCIRHGSEHTQGVPDVLAEAPGGRAAKG